MMRQYVRRSEYPDTEKLRELLSKVTDKEKLNILQQTKIRWDMTALHEAAYRDDAEMITTILSSLQSSDRLKLLMMRDNMTRTSLHAAASGSHTESVKAILNSLTADQQTQLLTEEGFCGKTAVDVSSDETSERLSDKAVFGEFVYLNSLRYCSPLSDTSFKFRFVIIIPPCGLLG